MPTIEEIADAAPRSAGQEVRFKRVLGLPALVFFGLAYMVPLTVWTTYGIVTTSTGGHLPLAYTVTTIAMALTAYSYGRMVLVQPIAGSAYSYASRSFGRTTGFMVGWALLLDYIFLPMINYLVIGLYMQDYFPSTPQALWVIIAVVLVTGLNILGIRLMANTWSRRSAGPCRPARRRPVRAARGRAGSASRGLRTPGGSPAR
jgi:putrescine importer